MLTAEQRKWRSGDLHLRINEEKVACVGLSEAHARQGDFDLPWECPDI
jgi:hypothetical protein